MLYHFSRLLLLHEITVFVIIRPKGGLQMDITAKQAREELGVSHQTLMKWIKEKRIIGEFSGHRWFISSLSVAIKNESIHTNTLKLFKKELLEKGLNVYDQ